MSDYEIKMTMHAMPPSWNYNNPHPSMCSLDALTFFATKFQREGAVRSALERLMQFGVDPLWLHELNAPSQESYRYARAYMDELLRRRRAADVLDLEPIIE